MHTNTVLLPPSVCNNGSQQTRARTFQQLLEGSKKNKEEMKLTVDKKKKLGVRPLPSGTERSYTESSETAEISWFIQQHSLAVC